MNNMLPMSPILVQNELPSGPDWVYQLKWDGFRVIASVRQGEVQLLSKLMAPKTGVYPELTEALSHKKETFVIDGEAIVLDPASGKPSFQRMQQRDKLKDSGAIRKAALNNPIQYILFDLLFLEDKDLRDLPYKQRFNLLRELVEEWGSPFYLADNYPDGEALWNWVEANGFEGVIAKRQSSTYKHGKEHSDWFKRKTEYRTTAEIVGILIKDGRISSLAMRKDGHYYGRISSGLSGKSKLSLSHLTTNARQEDYFEHMPEGLRSSKVKWLDQPLKAEVIGREVTDNGLLRHPKLLSIEGVPL